MSFEISCHLRFHLVWSASVNLNLFQISKEWFGTLKAISGMGWDGMGWLSRFDGLLRAPTVLITRSSEINVAPGFKHLRKNLSESLQKVDIIRNIYSDIGRNDQKKGLQAEPNLPVARMPTDT